MEKSYKTLIQNFPFPFPEKTNFTKEFLSEVIVFQKEWFLCISGLG